MENSQQSEPPVIPWFFHDFPYQLDDPNAPLPTSTATSADKQSTSSNQESSGQQQQSATAAAANTSTAVDNETDSNGNLSEVNVEKETTTVDPLAWGAKAGVYFSTTSYVGTVTPNTNWLAFSPGDNRKLESYYQDYHNSNGESNGDSDDRFMVSVGVNGIYSASLGKMSLNPIYWNSLKHSSNVHRSTWFYSNTLTPSEPTLEKAVADAFYQIRPWTTEYLTELKSALEVPEALEKIKVPITYYQYSEDPNKKPVRLSVLVVFAPCCQHPTTDDNNNNDSEDSHHSENDESDEKANGTEKSTSPASPENKPKTADYPIAYVFSRPSYSTQMLPMLSSIPNGQQLINALLGGKTPSGAMFTLQRHFSWDAWKKLKSLPDRPTDDPEYKHKKFTQLVLVLHGIGQKLSDRVESFNFTYAINGFRISISDTLNHPGVKSSVEDDTAILTLPVNWRKTLNFEDLKRNKEDSIISEKEKYSLQDITMKSIPAVRNIISDVMLDIPYYMSHYKPLLLEAAAREANRIYDLFLKFNPGFEEYGKVNIIGHSLGSVIAMDLLSSQPTDVYNMSDEEKAREVKFNFNTSNLFLAGSPAAFFLLLENSRLYPRKMFDEKLKLQLQGKKDDQSHTAEGLDSIYGNISGSNLPYGCLAVENIYNVLHYSDPISYLLNPTVDPELAKAIEPAPLPSEKMFPIPGTEGSGFFENLTSRFPFWSEGKTPGRKNSVGNDDNKKEGTNNGSEDSTASTSETSSALPSGMPSEVELETRDFDKEYHAEKKMFMLNDNGQIDWMIPLTGTLENQYFSMLTAHSGYWDSKDFSRLVAIECGRKRGKENTIRQYQAKRK